MGYFKNLAILEEERLMGIPSSTIAPKNGQIKYVKQNIVDVQKGVIAHGCNYVGVMGAGVAAAIRNAHPEAFTEYAVWLRDHFPTRKDALGKTQLVEIVPDQLYVANCITQGLMGFDGQLATPEAIRSSLYEAFHEAAVLGLPIYLPKIGAGLGGLNWETDVEPIVSDLASFFDEVDTYVCVYP